LFRSRCSANITSELIGVAKAYCTRVGNGPFPSELDNELGEKSDKSVVNSELLQVDQEEQVG
jgi:adenylosuccinate synthase